MKKKNISQTSKIRKLVNVKNKKTRSYRSRSRVILVTWRKKYLKRGMQHEDFPRGHPSKYYSRPSTFNFGVLMGSGALVLVFFALSVKPIHHLVSGNKVAGIRSRYLFNLNSILISFSVFRSNQMEAGYFEGEGKYIFGVFLSNAFSIYKEFHFL